MVRNFKILSLLVLFFLFKYFLIVIFAFLLQGWYGKRATTIPGTGEICKWIANETLISCLGPKSIIECPAVANFTGLPVNLTTFALGRIATLNYTATELHAHKFWLYPRSIDTTKWLNRTLIVNNTTVDITFYHSGVSTNTLGIHVIDHACFLDLATLFTTIEIEDIVPIIAENTTTNIVNAIFGVITIE